MSYVPCPKAAAWAASTLAGRGGRRTGGSFRVHRDPTSRHSSECGGSTKSHCRYGAKLFRNFRCYVETDDGQAYYIAFHVRGKFAYDYDYLYDAS
jgi:hypothetical protein